MCRSSAKGRATGCGRQLLRGRSSGWLLPGGCGWLLLLRSSDWSGWLLRSSGSLLRGGSGVNVAGGCHESASRGEKRPTKLTLGDGWKTCRALDFETEERRIDEQYRTNTVCNKRSRKARVAAPQARALQERLVAAQWRGQLSVPLEPRRRHAAAVLVARGLPASVAQQRVRAMHGVCDRQAGRLGLGLGLVLVGRRYDSCQGLRIHNNSSRASWPYLRRSARRRAACRRPP